MLSVAALHNKVKHEEVCNIMLHLHVIWDLHLTITSAKYILFRCFFRTVNNIIFNMS
jgi:hypothetical protein